MVPVPAHHCETFCIDNVAAIVTTFAAFSGTYGSGWHGFEYQVFFVNGQVWVSGCIFKIPGTTICQGERLFLQRWTTVNVNVQG